MNAHTLRRVGLLAWLLLALGCGGGKSSSNVVVAKEKEVEAASPGLPAGPPLFRDVTKDSGVNFTYQNGEDEVVFSILETFGGGVAAVDYDGDGLVDLFFTGGGYYEGKKVLGHPCKLYRNVSDIKTGEIKFVDVSKEAGLDEVKWCYSHGASAADYDRDGFPDLLISGYSRLILLRNEAAADGKRKFVDVTEKAKLSDKLWSVSTAWGDLDGDGYPELYVCHYGDWGFDTNHPTDCTYYTGGKRDVCQPRRFKALPHALYKNNGDGTFAEGNDLVKTERGGHGLGVVMVDVNQDGKPDIYVANDTDDNFLFVNRSRKGEFVLEEKGFESSASRDDEGKPNGSMGADASSFDRSGKPAIVVTNYENELPSLYLNRCTGTQTLFSFGTHSTGLSLVGGNYVSWGTGFYDFENRGWEDLFIVSGHAIRYPLEKFGRSQKPQLLKNVDGKLLVNNLSGGPYFQERHNARGTATVDLNNDGKLDLVVSHLNAPATILRNVSEGKNHWLGLNLRGINHRDLVGTRVVLTVKGEKQYRFVKGGGGYASTNDARVHFGLGTAEKADSVRIEWARGEAMDLQGFDGKDLYLTVEEPARKE